METCKRCNRTQGGCAELTVKGGYCNDCGPSTSEHRAYVALLEKAIATGRPSAFVADLLVHDRRTVSNLPESHPFVWMARESGTGLMVNTKGWTKEGLAAMASEHRFYLWNGQCLSEVTADQAWFYMSHVRKETV